MAEQEPQVEPQQGSPALNLPQKRLIESTLYQEDVLHLDHSQVWGSWYDPTAKRWGYACCREVQKDIPCPTAKAAAEAAAAAPAHPSGIDHSSGEEVTSPDTEPEPTEQTELNWGNPPQELPPRSQGGTAAQYIEHFVRYYIGYWERHLAAGLPNFSDIERQALKDSLPDVKKAVTPLVWRLKRGINLQRGENSMKTGKASRCRETRTSMEGKHVEEANVLQSLERMAAFAQEREYMEAHKIYMRLAFGNKMWNLTHVAHVAACTMKGAREYRRNRDSLNTYDMDPVSQKYMHAVKRLVYFAQCVNPNPDQSRNVVI